MKSKDYKTLLYSLTQNIKEGVLIVDAEGKGILYNDMMSKLEKTKKEDVLGKNVREVFIHIPEEESTLSRALKYKKATINLQQTFINQYGKEITTLNTTIPVENENGEIIAAIEIARDITGIKALSNTVLDLQSEAIGTATSKKKGGIKYYTFEDLIGKNEDFIGVVEKCKRVAKVDASVLLYGETGTGKELFAQSIHNESDRSEKPFLAQNCAALPESLLEGILFGTTKGGFTGATDREGLFEQANGGTLLLDEISAMPYDLQSKLLRVLQENYIRRIGGMKDIPIDVRIIATINEKAEDLIARGKLRRDLYYRLKIIEINIPPLRERADDIILLADYYLEKYNRELERQIQSISEEAKKLLLQYNYPGNVRELQHIIMSSIVSMDDEDQIINGEQLDLPNHARLGMKLGLGMKLRLGAGMGMELLGDMKDKGLEEYLSSIEKEAIRVTMESCGGYVSKAAKQLGIKRQTLQHKLKKFDIPVNRVE